MYSYRGRTDGVRVCMQRGIKQGDLLPPFLFNLTMDPFTRILNTSAYVYQIQGTTVSALAYDDDLILIACTQEELSRNLEVAQHYFSKIGLHLNSRKTRYFGWRHEAQRLKWFDYDVPPHYVGDTVVSPKSWNEPNRYLGLDLYINKPPKASIDLIHAQLDLVNSAQSNPFQKLRCISII